MENSDFMVNFWLLVSKFTTGWSYQNITRFKHARNHDQPESFINFTQGFQIKTSAKDILKTLWVLDVEN